MQTVAEQLLLDKDTEKVEPVRSEIYKTSWRSWGQSPEWISDGAGNVAAGDTNAGYNGGFTLE